MVSIDFLKGITTSFKGDQKKQIEKSFRNIDKINDNSYISTVYQGIMLLNDIDLKNKIIITNGYTNPFSFYFKLVTVERDLTP